MRESGILMHITSLPGPYGVGTIRTAMGSVSDLCVVPMRDYLDPGAEACMNFPGSLPDSNWTWRAKDDIIKKILAEKIRRLTKLYGRL